MKKKIEVFRRQLPRQIVRSSKPITSVEQARNALRKMFELEPSQQKRLYFLNSYLNAAENPEALRLLSRVRDKILFKEEARKRGPLRYAVVKLRASFNELQSKERLFPKPLVSYDKDVLAEMADSYQRVWKKAKNSGLKGGLLSEISAKMELFSSAHLLNKRVYHIDRLERKKRKSNADWDNLESLYKDALTLLPRIKKLEQEKAGAKEYYNKLIDNLRIGLSLIRAQ